MDDEVVEQTLHVSREVKVFGIPPRPPTGHKSGEWKVADEVFSGRLRVVAKGELLEVRFEDTNTGELFAMSPIPPDKRDAYVEAVTDSSRYFAIRVEDPASGRHAFLGMGFTERGEAFDFNVALSDHVKQCKRQKEIEQIKEAGGETSTLASGDAQILYQPHRDLSLKQGQTIHVAVKHGDAGKRSTGGGLFAKAPVLAPPPAPGGGLLAPPPSVGLMPPPPSGLGAPATSQFVQQPQQQTPVSAPTPAGDGGWTAFSDAPPPASSTGGWANFD